MKKIVALLTISFCQLAYALNLGELSVRSVPGEPLQAIVPIEEPPKDVSTLRVALATNEEFSDAVISYTEEHNELEFSIEQNGPGKAHIRLTSANPLQDEVLHFILALKTTDARLLREYVIIQEGEMYATNAQPTAVKTLATEKTHGRVPVTSLGEAAKRSKKEQGSAAHIVRYYRVKPGDNLWYIAHQLQRRYPSASFYQLLASLYQTNQTAFIDGNMNKLLAGAKLYLPSAKQTKQLNAQQAMHYVEEQLTLEPMNAQPTMTQIVASNEGLRILAPKTVQELSSEQARLGQGLALVNESLEQVQRDNESLRKRVQSLQKQIDMLKEMVTLRKQQRHTIKTEEETVMQATPPAEAPGITLSTTGWTVVNQLWKEITHNQWMFYLVMTLGVLAVALLVMSIYVVYRLGKTDKAVKAVMETSVAPAIVCEKPEISSKKPNKTEVEDGDKMGIKLELAQAYYNLGDTTSAKTILQEVLKEGNATQKQKAQSLLDKME